jgi:hypothetical protein
MKPHHETVSVLALNGADGNEPKKTEQTRLFSNNRKTNTISNTKSSYQNKSRGSVLEVANRPSLASYLGRTASHRRDIIGSDDVHHGDLTVSDDVRHGDVVSNDVRHGDIIFTDDVQGDVIVSGDVHHDDVTVSYDVRHDDVTVSDDVRHGDVMVSHSDSYNDREEEKGRKRRRVVRAHCVLCMLVCALLWLRLISYVLSFWIGVDSAQQHVTNK